MASMVLIPKREYEGYKTFLRVASKKTAIRLNNGCTPEVVLLNFMAQKGIFPINSVASEYKRKDGQIVPSKTIEYSNGNKYMVTAQRFWKLRE